MTYDDFYSIIAMTEYSYTWASYPLVVFMLISGLVMLNLVIAVLCEALNALNSTSDVNDDSKTFIVNGGVMEIGQHISRKELEKRFLECHEEKKFYKIKDEKNEKLLKKLETRHRILQNTFARSIKNLPSNSER